MSTANTVYDQLRAAIIDGTFQSGDPLRQDQIASDYGISKIPVREALVHLEADGFVEMFSGRGAFVARLSAKQAEEIYLMRIALEPILIERAVPQTSEANWLRTEGVLSALLSDGLSFHEWHALDYEFHTSLYQHADLPSMKKLVANLHSNLARYYRVYHTLGDDFRHIGNTEHKVILNACKTNDIETASQTLKKHLIRSSERLLQELMS